MKILTKPKHLDWLCFMNYSDMIMTLVFWVGLYWTTSYWYMADHVTFKMTLYLPLHYQHVLIWNQTGWCISNDLDLYFEVPGLNHVLDTGCLVFWSAWFESCLRHWLSWLFFFLFSP